MLNFSSKVLSEKYYCEILYIKEKNRNRVENSEVVGSTRLKDMVMNHLGHDDECIQGKINKVCSVTRKIPYRKLSNKSSEYVCACLN